MDKFSSVKINGFSPCHIQGIAIDKKREYMYYSFTTSLIKTDLQGNLIGSVKGIVGHLGCLAYNYEDGRVYASLEYKSDSIGEGILKTLNKSVRLTDSFYVAVFDTDKITRPDMDAEKDGIMTAVYLKEVSDDYLFPGHKYGCSGIDGITFAPIPGTSEGNHLFIAYGIYSDNKRKDNDYQILLRYDVSGFKTFKQPLTQDDLHKNGPLKPEVKYFIYTGNTTYGIQNLEYDRDNNCLFAAVYKGKKLRFPNFSMYAIDMENEAEYEKLKGINESANTLKLKKLPFFNKKGQISGCNFPFGTTGMISLGEGRFLFSEDFKDENGYGTEVFSYILDCEKGFIKKEITL